MDHLTFAQLLGNYGEFVGAIAVVGTLIYLAIQVRQSKRSLDANTRAIEASRKQERIEMVRQMVNRWDEVFRHASGNQESASIFVRGNRDLRELNEIEQTIYISQLIPFLDHHLFSLQMAQEGHLGDDYVGGENFMELLDVLIGDMLRNNPGARQWWESIKFAYPHHDYVNALIDTKQKTKRWTIGTAMAESAP